MATRFLEQKVMELEHQMAELRDTPARLEAVESQIVQLRSESRDEFLATRTELRAEIEQVRTELREEIRSGDDETRRLARALHEDVLARIAMMAEGFPVLRGEMYAIRDELRGEIRDTQALIRAAYADLKSEIASLRTRH